MIDRFVQIPTKAGTMETFVAHPSDNAPFPAVVLYMDVWGVREELFDIARRVASVGYYCMVPDLYYRQGRIRQGHFDAGGRMISLHHLDETQQRAALRPLFALENEMLLDDTAALIEFTGKGEPVRPGPMGCFGYCLGGNIILRVAGTFPERFRACAGMHASNIVTDKPDSAHLVARNAQGEIYLGFGERDAFATPPVIATAAKTLGGRGLRYRYQVHKGVQHGYALPDRDVHDKAATLSDWEHIFAMFHRQIPPAFGG